MSVESDLIAHAEIEEPDGRPLFAYWCTDAQRAQLGHDLALRLDRSPANQVTAARFVIWAAEEIRANLPPGRLTWDWLFGRLGRTADVELGRTLTLRGLESWSRAVRLSEGGSRQYLYSLMAEGGLPDAYLAEAVRYRGTVLAMLSEIEAEGALGPAAAERVARRRVADLPQTFRNEDTALLLADLALALAHARTLLPLGLPPEAAEAWLDQRSPDWRAHLPLRLSPAAFEALIRPALRAVRGEARRPSGFVFHRELRRRADGGGWVGYAAVNDGAVLAARFLDDADPSLRLRLQMLADGDGPGLSFLGVPEPGGWRLVRTGGGAEAAVRLPPDRPLILAAFADGRPMGEALVDTGLPLPEVAPSFWRALDAEEDPPVRLERLTGSARTRAARLWLLAGPDAQPIAGGSVTLGTPRPAPGGQLWPITGSGTVTVVGQELRVATGAESETLPHRLHVFGRVLPRWRTEGGQIPFVESPEFWGAESDGALHYLRTGVAQRSLPRCLCGRIAEWSVDGDVVARTSFIALPEGVRLELAETSPGALMLAMEGLVPGWHVGLTTADARSAVVMIRSDGSARLALAVDGQAAAELRLRLSDPATGAALVLLAPWPARRGMMVGPDGARLAGDQGLAVGALGGWRAFVPMGRSGTLELRHGAKGLRLGLTVAGEVRLAAAEPLARTMLALGGLDAEVRLRLIVGGEEGHRLTLKRYDDGARKVGNMFLGGASTWTLHAVALDPPGEVRAACEVRGPFDLAAWLSDTSKLWLAQARSADGGVARPLAWHAGRRPASTRAARIAGYAADWRRLLDAPGDPAWDVHWALIRAAHDGGDAGALDQVQALGETPEAAVALLFRVAEAELAEALALEGSAPLWWPITPISAWVAGASIEMTRCSDALASLSFPEAERRRCVGEMIARRVGIILLLRPELRGHLGAALVTLGFPPVVQAARGPEPLAFSQPRTRLRDLARDAVERFEQLPDGTAGLRAHPKHRLDLGNEAVRPLLDAPVVAAEIAQGLRSDVDTTLRLQLLGLRQADPIWFDAALPVAVQHVLEESRR